MYFNVIIVAIFFIILISIQYTLNKILLELRGIKEILNKCNFKR
ncbi:hypothetical protein [Caloranaerobacter sp. TR13]|nr:hypothetical protein [Caloranaerobacter sp. TR13]